jgi:hypothetical protein
VDRKVIAEKLWSYEVDYGLSIQPSLAMLSYINEPGVLYHGSQVVETEKRRAIVPAVRCK